MRFTRWDQVASTKETNDIVKRLALLHASRICDATERERLTGCIAGDRFSDLCDYNFPYETASTWDLLCMRQACALYSKRADIDIGVDRREVAIGKFVAAERLCAQTNDIFRKRAAGLFSFSPAVDSVLHTAQRKVASILGDVPNLSEVKPRFGPGATTQVQKRIASPWRKLGQTYACSKELAPLVREHLEEMAGWVFQHSESEAEELRVPVEIHHGKLAFVPKSAKTDRSVVVEPMLNSMFQLAYGDYLSERLQKAGVSTRDQTRNQRLALMGSLDGSLATVDLSSASDTIATAIVFELLPFDWAETLSLYRTGSVEFAGFVLEQEKFSSMGNGYTFPLETLLFYCLAYACTAEHERHLVSCYGDDIIVPTAGYRLLMEVLSACGFVPNADKSFSAGPFRESCGADYHKGIDIRPVYLKDRLAGFDAFRLHNFFVRANDEESASILLDCLDQSLRLWGPDGYGDGHLIGDDVPLRPHGRGKGWAGYTFESYTFGSRFDFKINSGDRVYPSYSIYARESEDGVSHNKDLRSLAIALREIQSSASPMKWRKDGSPGISIPGVKGYKTIRVYVLR